MIILVLDGNFCHWPVSEMRQQDSELVLQLGDMRFQDILNIWIHAQSIASPLHYEQPMGAVPKQHLASVT